jgi:hypothetical protein
MTERDECNETRSVVPPTGEAEGLPTRVKLQATLGIERAIFPTFVIGIFVILFTVILAGGKHGNGVIGYQGLLIGLGIGAALWLGAALTWILVDDYYILDRQLRQIWIHKGFRFFGRETMLFTGSEVVAIGLNCTKLTYKGGQYGWRYVPVLLVRNHEPIKLSAMDTDVESDKLDSYNQKTRSWAAILGCQWIECPPKQEFNTQYDVDLALEADKKTSLV